jgi:hypothetical protein
MSKMEINVERIASIPRYTAVPDVPFVIGVDVENTHEKDELEMYIISKLNGTSRFLLTSTSSGNSYDINYTKETILKHLNNNDWAVLKSHLTISE